VAGVRCDDEHPSAFLLLPRLEPIGSRSSPQKFREQTWLKSSVATPAAVCRTANLFASLRHYCPCCFLIRSTWHARVALPAASQAGQAAGMGACAADAAAGR
jgi:hypothetical protein